MLDSNKSTRDNSQCVTDEIQKVLQRKCISEVFKIPRVVNPLTVTTSIGKRRLVLDTRHINPQLFNFVTSMKIQAPQRGFLINEILVLVTI